MKIFLLILLLFSLLFFFPGCEGHCIKVGGEYEGVSGDIEYCFNSAETSEAGVPSFNLSTDEGIIDQLYAFTGEQINKITDKIRGTLGISVKLNKKQHPVKELLELLEVKENAKHGDNEGVHPARE